jgi:integrase/recombinase XerD
MIREVDKMPQKRKSPNTEAEEELLKVIEKFGRDKVEGIMLNKLGMVRKEESTTIQNLVIPEKSPLNLTLYEAKKIFLKDFDFRDVTPKSEETYRSELRVYLKHSGLPDGEKEQSCQILLKDVIQPVFLKTYLEKYNNVNTKSKKASFLRVFIKTVAPDEYKKKEDKYRTTLEVKYQKNHVPLAFKEEQTEELLSLVKNGACGFRNYTIVQVLLNTGLRVNELRNIQIKDIDFENSTVKVIPKRHVEEVKVLITEEALGLLRTFINFTYAHQKRTLTEEAYRELFVFSSSRGKEALTSKSIQRVFQQAVAKAQTIPECDKYVFIDGKKVTKKHCYGPHSCRHTFALNLLSTGVDIYMIKELLNHASIASTEKYLKLFDEQLKAAVEKNPILDAAQLENLKNMEKDPPVKN